MSTIKIQIKDSKNWVFLKTENVINYISREILTVILIMKVNLYYSIYNLLKDSINQLKRPLYYLFKLENNSDQIQNLICKKELVKELDKYWKSFEYEIKNFNIVKLQNHF